MNQYCLWLHFYNFSVSLRASKWFSQQAGQSGSHVYTTKNASTLPDGAFSLHVCELTVSCLMSQHVSRAKSVSQFVSQ